MNKKVQKPTFRKADLHRLIPNYGIVENRHSRDVKVLKELSQRFVFDLAKGDLTYYYQQCIDGMDEIRKEAWSLYKYGDWSQRVHLTVKEKIATLRLLKECNEAKFNLLEKGPSVLNVKAIEEKLENIKGQRISQ